MAIQAAPQAQQPIGVIYDSSLDGGIDQVLALAMLFYIQDTRRIRIGAISTSRYSVQSAAFLDALARFFTGGGGDYGPSRALLPVGMAITGDASEVVEPMVSTVLGRTGADGQPTYRRGIEKLNDVADGVALIRNALTAYNDGAAAVILAGSPNNLNTMLSLPDGPRWAGQKARLLCIGGGRFAPGAPDPTVAADVAGYRKLLAEWPGQIVMAGAELNDALPFPGGRIGEANSWAPEHPVVDAYRAFRSMPYDGPTQTLAAVLHVVYPEEGYFTLSEPGTITVQSDGTTQFAPNPDGRHHYLTVAADQKERILETYVKMITEEATLPTPPARSDASPPSSISRPATLLGLGGLVGMVTLVGCMAASQSREPAMELSLSQTDFDQAVKPILEETCAMCHTGADGAGGLDVSGFTTAASVLENRATFERMLARLKAGEMPPPGVPKPDADKLAAMIGYIESTFALADAQMQPDPGRMIAHRLNRTEYSNTIRDLFGVQFRADRDFPADDSGHGFDTIGELLNISPLLMERYMAAAERIALWALSTEIPEKPLEIDYRARDERIRRMGRSIIEVDHQVEFPGEYIVRFELPGERAARDGVDAAPVMLGLWMDGELLATKQIETKPSGLVYFNPYSEEEMRLYLPAGDHVFRAAFIDDEFVRTLPEEQVYRTANNKFLDGIVFNGPFASDEETESRKRILTCDPGTGRACVQEIIGDLARRAYRRPVTEREVEALIDFVDLAQENGQTVEEGLQLAIQAMLVSPHFLFRIERDPDPRDPSSIHEVSQFELASRLSYFLWSSMPDEELFSLAEEGRLSDPATLDAQVDRMLSDPRAAAFAENFAGQWLETRNLDVVRPDPDLFAAWDIELRESMKRETAMFFQHVMSENRPISDFLDADYTFLNERLAAHYGIEGVTGPEFRRVDLATEQRGGILGQGAVLTVSSYPTRTSPVIRGKYVLENVLGLPPPPPPPDVPALEASGDGTTRSMREQLSLHRSNPICSSCHSKMDPLGFGLENYDAIGRWRESDGEFPIDPTGALPDGEAFATSAEMRAMLARQLPQFSRALTEKMLTYALRRGLEVYDRPTVEKIQTALESEDYRLQTMVREIVKSLPFQARRGEDVLAVSH